MLPDNRITAMYGYNGYHNNYDPFPFMMMMSNFFNKDKRNEELKEEDVIRHFKKYKDLYQDMKKEFEPPKKDDPKPAKKEGEWTTNDYFLFITCFVTVSVLGGGYMILRELVEFAKVIHAH